MNASYNFATLCILAVSIAAVYSPPAAPAQSGTLSELPASPYRQIGDQCYDLSARYAFLARGKTAPPEALPCASWIGDDFLRVAYPLAFDYCVERVCPDGLLIQKRMIGLARLGGGAVRKSGEPFFLKNYPAQSDAFEGKTIIFLALANGVKTISDSPAIQRTIRCYDCGAVITASALNAWRATQQSRLRQKSRQKDTIH